MPLCPTVWTREITQWAYWASPALLSTCDTGTCGAALLSPLGEVCGIACDALMAAPPTAPDVYLRPGKADGRDADSAGRPRSSGQSACGQRRGNDPKHCRREASPARLPVLPDMLEARTPESGRQ